MKKLLANFISMFFLTKQKRHAIRSKFLRKEVLRQKKVEYQVVKQKLKDACGTDLLVPGRFLEYDLIFGIGATCHVTSVLGTHCLRRFSTPFDWTGGVPQSDWMAVPDVWRDTRFSNKINMLLRNFDGDFERENFKLVSVGIKEHSHHIVVDVKNGVRYMHHFPIDKSLESYFPEFYNTMKRRADRLSQAIKVSNRILILWIHRFSDQVDILDDLVSDKDAIDAMKKLKQAYPDKDFDIVFFECDGNKTGYEFEKNMVDDGIFRIRSNHYVVEDAYRFKYPYVNLTIQPIIAEALDNISLTGLLKDMQTKTGWLSD